MYLITELNEEIQVIKEDIPGAKTPAYFIEGIFLQCDITNRNGRRYPSDILEREVQRYTNENIIKNRAYGELGHPSGPAINLERVSHMTISLIKDGNNFLGKAKIITGNPYGAIVKNFLDEGACLGVSSRGLGSLVKKNGIDVVSNDFQLATAADIVADPSAPDAFVRGIMEGKEWVYENGVIHERKIQAYKRALNNAAASVKKSALNEEEIAVFTDFLDCLSGNHTLNKYDTIIIEQVKKEKQLNSYDLLLVEN